LEAVPLPAPNFFKVEGGITKHGTLWSASSTRKTPLSCPKSSALFVDPREGPSIHACVQVSSHVRNLSRWCTRRSAPLIFLGFTQEILILLGLNKANPVLRSEGSMPT
jgi:hypothetical protein